MKRNYILSLMAAFMLLPFTNVKAQYHIGDSTAIHNIMTNNFAAANLLNWNDPNPGNWLGVVWDNLVTPYRIVELSLKASGIPTNGTRGINNWTIDHANYHNKYVNWDTAGVATNLIGDLDFTALSELKRLKVSSHDSITSINVQGLNKLEYLYAGGNNLMDTLDASNLPNLYSIHCGSNNSLVYLNASNCSRLKRVKATYCAITDVNLTGSDSIRFLSLRDNDITSLDVSTKTELLCLQVADNPNLTSLVGLQNLSNLFALKIADTQIGGMIDIAWFNTDSLYKFGAGRTALDSVANWTMFRTDVESVNVEENRLTLSNATQIFNELAPSNQYGGNDQIRYDGDTIYVGNSKNYSSQAIIDISGNNVTSTFSLFDATGTQVGASNTTGMFTFPTINDTGEYYTEMTNPGDATVANATLLTTNNFWVLKCAVDTSTSVSFSTITATQTGATYRWLDCNNGNAVILGATGQSYTPSVNGDYAVEITQSAPCSVVDTSACVNMATVGIDNITSISANIYPNPTTDQFTIQLGAIDNNTQIAILDVAGTLVYSAGNLTSNKLVVNSANWSKGIYFVKVTNNDATNTFKLVK
jgi:hypothetical protein